MLLPELFAPELRLVRGVDELRLDVQHVALLHDAAGEDRARVQAPGRRSPDRPAGPCSGRRGCAGRRAAPASCDRLLMMLSVMPSAMCSSCGSAPALTKGSTASDFPRARGAPCRHRRRRSGEQAVQRHREILRRLQTAGRDRVRSLATRSRAAPPARPDRTARDPGRLSCIRLATISCGVAPVNSRRAGEHLVEHAAAREDVAPAVHALAGDLLGRHVAERAEDDALGGPRHRRGRASPVVEALQREAEVEDLHQRRRT